ncbi:type I glyceraldehyde-3-phosphate dehydrogenase [Candidatus Woesearchaeota archaeon]|nr:type I glyceraldehyde-3-phosphate dehydrogenase [Candidatus Woesearchaeota archaeon]
MLFYKACDSKNYINFQNEIAAVVQVLRVAINGFGRIGRQVLQAGIGEKGIEWVAVNDLATPETLAYLLKYDSVHGRSPVPVIAGKDHIIVAGRKIKVLSEKEPEKLPWKQLKIDVVVESTGIFSKREDAEKHLQAGAKKVLITAPGKGPMFTVVKGVNDGKYNKKTDHIVSNASCTTNCLAPIARVLADSFGIKHGAMTTVHSYTADQRLVDAPHRDPRRGRSAAINIVPTSTGAAKAVTETIPELRDKLNGHALRVPTPDGSLTDFVCIVKKPTTVDRVNDAFRQAAKGYMKGIIEYTDEPIVSSDIIGNPASAVFDSQMTMVIDSVLVKVMAWYDNEIGYSRRTVDILKTLI